MQIQGKENMSLLFRKQDIIYNIIKQVVFYFGVQLFSNYISLFFISVQIWNLIKKTLKKFIDERYWNSDDFPFMQTVFMHMKKKVILFLGFSQFLFIL